MTEQSLLFWLGADARDVAIHYITQQQRALELSPIVDTSDIDE